MATMATDQTRWVARLTPAGGGTVRDLLQLPLALDVWQREGEVLIVAAAAATLDEMERRRLATIERLYTTTEYEARARRAAGQPELPER
jgi:uncharacterized membrane protein YeiH